MIKHLSHRNNISGTPRASKPLCANVIDFSDQSDPSEPLPSTVSLTVNAPAKAGFTDFGIVGFTASANSFGITSSSPSVPFTVISPTRNNVLLNFNRESLTNQSISSITVRRFSDSPGTVFDTPVLNASSVPNAQEIKISQVNGLYLRSDLRYIITVFVSTLSTGGVSARSKVLAVLYSTVKFLPLKFTVKGLMFESSVRCINGEFSCEYSGTTIPPSSFDCTAITSFQVHDLVELGPGTEIPIPAGVSALLYGSSSLVFDFNSV